MPLHKKSRLHLYLGHLSRSLSFASNIHQLSVEKDEWTAVFPVGACCDRGSEAGIQRAHPVQVQR
jgi:hypothetical protein